MSGVPVFYSPTAHFLMSMSDKFRSVAYKLEDKYRKRNKLVQYADGAPIMGSNTDSSGNIIRF